MNVRLFPFDKQNCTLTFGSWTFDAAGIDFFPLRDFVSFESYVSNEEWRVLSFDYHREVSSVIWIGTLRAKYLVFRNAGSSTELCF